MKEWELEDQELVEANNEKQNNAGSELPRPIEVGASCFNHHSFVNDIRYRSLTRCPQA